MRDRVPSFFESLMVDVAFRDTSNFFYLHNQGEKRGDKDYLSIGK